MKYLIGILTGLLLITVGFWLGITAKDTVFDDSSHSIFSGIAQPKPLDLSMYSIDNLSNSGVEIGKIEILEKTQDKESFTSYLFKFSFYPNPRKEYHKSTTGVINFPKDTDNPPLLLMIRGYVDQEYFVSGMGTRRSSEYFAENGFITIAPDFLGYGDSDDEAGNIFETRFQTYTTTISLIETLEELDSLPELINCHSGFDPVSCELTKIRSYEKLFLWAHSNGGQIVLTTLAITGKNYPTVLWAPVTKPFPYSVLYYTDESDDGGKLIRNELTKLEINHKVEDFSFTNHIDRLNAPIQIYQGTLDDAVPQQWNQDFSTKLNKSYKERGLDKNVDLIIKSRADHNLTPLWQESVSESLGYFNSFLD